MVLDPKGILFQVPKKGQEWQKPTWLKFKQPSTSKEKKILSNPKLKQNLINSAREERFLLFKTFGEQSKLLKLKFAKKESKFIKKGFYVGDLELEISNEIDLLRSNLEKNIATIDNQTVAKIKLLDKAK